MTPTGLVPTGPTRKVCRGLQPVVLSQEFGPASDEIQNEIRLVAMQVRAALGGDPIQAWVEIVPNGSLGQGVGGLNNALGELHQRRRDLIITRGVVVDCVIKLTESVVDGLSLDTTTDVKPIVIHEVFHCWQYGRLDFDVQDFRSMDHWVKEGTAAYFGELHGGPSRYTANWWTATWTARSNPMAHGRSTPRPTRA